MWKLLPGVLLGASILFGAAPALAQCTPSGCDDANPCTDDICDPTLGCRHFNNSGSCTDGNSCTTNDVCSQGACVGGPPAAGCTACQAAATLPALGGTFVGATTGSSTQSGSCGTSQNSPERVYRWTPSSSGVATFQTCGSGTNYDSVVYVRSGTCTGSQLSCNDDGPCATSNSSDLGSRATANVTAGQTYFVVVDGYNGRSGSYSLTVTPPTTCGNGVREGVEACDGGDSSACTTGQCTSQCTCVPPSQGLPDLRPEITNWSLQRGASVSDGDVAEGCAESTSGVDLLRFGVRVRNEGNADLFFGDPGCPNCAGNPLAACANPNYTCSPAEGHNHPHYSNYARYELIDPGSQAVVIGHKQGFCLLDLECSSSRYTCNYQGISAGCADVYSSDLGCQYLDVTGIAPGNYTLRVTADPFGRISELDEGDNVVTTPVTIGAPGSNACTNPAVIPAAGGVFDGSTGGSSTQSGTCANTGSAPEKVYQWTPTASGTATIQTCSSTNTSFDTVLYLRNGTCQGAQSACNDDASSCATASGGGQGSRITPTVTAGQTYFIFVDGYNTSFGNFRLTVTPPNGSPPPPPPPPPPGGACESPTVIPAAGGVFTGTTSGSSTASGTCGSSGSAPERVFAWTPTRTGTATIQTCGNNTRFDTILYMRSGTCQSGTQTACNDDTSGCDTFTGLGFGSRIRPSVTAGQTYYIFVDGYGTGSGNFTLSVTAP
jgi:hypothetical protein